MSSSPVALVHDYLLVLRGAERTFAAIAECWPDAPIYTLLYDEEGTGGRFAGREIHTSYLQRLGVGQRRFRSLLPAFPRAARSLRARRPRAGGLEQQRLRARRPQARGRPPCLLLPHAPFATRGSRPTGRWRGRPATEAAPGARSRDDPGSRPAGLARGHPLRRELRRHPGAHRRVLGAGVTASSIRRSRSSGSAPSPAPSPTSSSSPSWSATSGSSWRSRRQEGRVSR